MTEDGRTSTTTAGTGIPPEAALAAHVRGYAEAVRLHLADLGPEVTDDLTGGLEADLTEALADRLPAGTPSGRSDDVVLDLALAFGPAAAYAAELRSAAGLPPEGPPRRPGLRGALADRTRRSRERWTLRAHRTRERWAARLQPLTELPGWASLVDLARVLRPVWWFARGWVLGVLLVVILSDDNLGVLSSDNGWYLVPASSGQLVVMAGCALVSVQWGRGRWFLPRWQRRTTVAASVVAVLALPAVLGATGDLTLQRSAPERSYNLGYQDGIAMASYDGYEGVPGDDGVWVDGMQVSNLFAFDENGEPIRDVQIFDDRGRAVRTITPEGSQSTWTVPQIDGSWYFRPTLADDGHGRWNVYPLQAVPENGMEWNDDGTVLEPVVGVRPEDMPWPFLKAPTTITRAAPGDQPEAPSEQPEAGPTPSPSASGAPAPSASADPSGNAPSDPQGGPVPTEPNEQVTYADGGTER